MPKAAAAGLLRSARNIGGAALLQLTRRPAPAASKFWSCLRWVECGGVVLEGDWIHGIQPQTLRLVNIIWNVAYNVGPTLTLKTTSM